MSAAEHVAETSRSVGQAHQRNASDQYRGLGIDRTRLVRIAATGDALAVGIAVLSAFVLRFKIFPGVEGKLNYGAVTVGLAVAWLALLALRGAYEVEQFAAGAEEYRRVAVSSIWLFTVVGLSSYMLRLDVARLYLATALPLGLTLLLGHRFLFRGWLGRQRSAGRQVHRVLAVGDRNGVKHLAGFLQPSAYVGYTVVAACLNTPETDAADVTDVVDGTPVLGTMDTVLEAARACDADTVVVAASSPAESSSVRHIAWQLSGSGIDLILAPSLADVAVTRLVFRSIPNLPLLHVVEPRLRGTSRLLKRALDLAVASCGVLLLAPALAVVAAAIRLTSRGPAFFRQSRIGEGGREFRVWKLRTMYADADAHLPTLMSEHAGGARLFFKLRDDPRVTPLGRWLRRYSLDEVPQLFNVIAGQMSLVGPRPQRQHEVELYDEITRRRLLVKPGMTGLWQVSGRSDLTVDEGIRLDLSYVENWSIALDLLIMLRTARAVFAGHGAY